MEHAQSEMIAALPLSVWQKLAEALELGLAEVFTDDAPLRQRSPAADASVLEAALLQFGGRLDAAALAGGLGWSLGRLSDALEALADTSERSGRRPVRDREGHYRLAARRSLLTTTQWHALHESISDQAGSELSSEAALVLHDLLYGQRRLSCEDWADEETAIGELLARRLIEPAGVWFRVAAEVSYSQGRDERSPGSEA